VSDDHFTRGIEHAVPIILIEQELIGATRAGETNNKTHDSATPLKGEAMDSLSQMDNSAQWWAGGSRICSSHD
jgi:hypothetical protein